MGKQVETVKGSAFCFGFGQKNKLLLKFFIADYLM